MKKIITILTIVIACLLAFTGCSGDNYTDKVNINGAQNTAYRVEGNGGSVVRYGNYLYFINGTRGYADTDGKSNVYGEVVKGALYRAELVGEQDTSDASNFIIKRDENSGIKLVSEKGQSYDNKEINVVNVQLISPKTIGTEGYADGGLYAFGKYIYYASPCNGKDKDGNVMSDYNEFFRTDLTNGETQKLLTSETANKSKPYGFYNYGGKVYLTYVETTDDGDYIVSATIGDKGVTAQNKIANKVTDVVMPTNATYYKGMETNSVYDFIYYGALGSDIETYRSDKLMCFVRPDGSENTIFSEGNDATLLGVEGGMVLYKMTMGANAAIRATDMHNYFMSGSKTYADAFGANEYVGSFDSDKTVLTNAQIASATAINCFVPGQGVNTNAVYVLLTAANATTTTNNDLTLYAPNGSVTVIASAEKAKFQTATTDKIIYSASAESSLQISSVAFDGTDNQVIYSHATEATFAPEIEAGYLVFFGSVDNNKYSGYTMFYDLNGLEGANDAFFVGKRLDSEVSSNVGSIELNTEAAKLTYVVGESLNVNNLYFTTYTYDDEDGNKEVIKEKVNVTADMVSGFDSTTVSDSVTVTVTYKGVTDTYQIAVISGDSDENAGCGNSAAIAGSIIAGVVILAAAAVIFILLRKKNANE